MKKKINICHCCGHWQSHYYDDWKYRDSSRLASYKSWLASRSCDACLVEEIKEKSAKNGWAMLSGSPSAVVYADSCRDKLLRVLNDYVFAPYDDAFSDWAFESSETYAALYDQFQSYSQKLGAFENPSALIDLYNSVVDAGDDIGAYLVSFLTSDDDGVGETSAVASA